MHGMAWREGVPKNREYIFDTKNKGKNNRSSCIKLRHAKVVVSRQYPRKKPVSGMHSSRYRIVWCFFPEKKTLWINIGGVWMAGFVVAVVPDSVAVVVCRSSAKAVVLVRN